MKKTIQIAAVILILTFLLPTNTLAANNPNDNNIILLDDGSYIVIEIESIQSRASSNRIASKAYTYYDSNSIAQWKATLTGTFYYNGTTSLCVAAGSDVTIYKSVWSLGSKSATKSGDTATGEFIITLSLLLGASVDVPLTLTLTCDKNGNMT